MQTNENQTVAIFSSQHQSIGEAENAGALYSVDIEHPLTLNDLSRLCDAIADALGAPDGVRYQFVTQPEQQS